MKVIPQSAALYRAAVRDLNSTLHDLTERAEARALIADLLGRQVRIRQDGAAVFARLEIDEAVLLASAAESLEIKDFQVGSGGRDELYSNYVFKIQAVAASIAITPSVPPRSCMQTVDGNGL